MGCAKCGVVDDRLLYALVDGVSYCSRCWIAAGRPWPRLVATPAEAFQARAATEERMLARGGAHRHLVRKGLT